jgi:hypothetical protein
MRFLVVKILNLLLRMLSLVSKLIVPEILEASGKRNSNANLQKTYKKITLFIS